MERHGRQLILDRHTQMGSRTEAAVAAAAGAEAAKAHTALQGFLYLGHQPRRVGGIGAPSRDDYSTVSSS